MTYRFLEQDELDKLDDVFDKYGWSKLHPIYSRVVVAEEDGEIVGFLCVQAVIHTEPMYVRPDKRGGEIARELSNQMVKFLEEKEVDFWFCHSDNPYVISICKENGMQEVRAFKKQ